MRTLLVSLALLGGCNASQAVDAGSSGMPDLAAPVARFSEEGPPPAIDAVKQAAGAVDTQRVLDAITRLSDFPTRNSCSDGAPGGGTIGAARDWIRGQLDAVPGMKTQLEAFAVEACGAGTMQSNVVAWLPGAHPERLVVIGGHYDSRMEDALDGKSRSPGANDSGSQTAVVLEAARVLAAGAPKGGFDATLVFAAFAGEEQGTLGSAALVKDLPKLFPGGRVEAMLNCDIVGGDNVANDAAALTTFRLYSPGTPREIKGGDGKPDDVSPSRNVMRAIGQAAAVYVPAMTMIPKLREDRPGRGSDHQPFIAAGIPAVRFIEPNETLAHQHTADDRLEFVTPAYTARVASVVAAVAGTLAASPPPPQAPQVKGTSAAVTVTFPGAPPAGTHYVLAARRVDSNAYTARLRVAGAEPLDLRAADLHLDDGSDYYLSIAVSDGAGRESAFAYPEIRCDAAGCAAPADASNVTATK